MPSEIRNEAATPSRVPFVFLRHLTRGRDRNNEASSTIPDMVFDPPPKDVSPAAIQPEPRALSEAALAILAEADRYEAGYNWVVAGIPPVSAGVFVQDGEVWVWAVDRGDPERPVPLALIVDGGLVFEGWSEPAAGQSVISTGFRLTRHRSFVFEVDGVETRGPAFGGDPVWPSAQARAELNEFLTRTRKTWRDTVARRALQRDIDGVCQRLSNVDLDRPVDAPPPPVPASVRYLALRSRSRRAVSDPLAIAHWIIAEVMEDPHLRTMFCLDPAVAAILNLPAFNTTALRSDVSLALLCFWRRHYREIDLFSDEGLRLIQYRFATAPFISLKNNDLMVGPEIRERLSELSGPEGASDLPWSWYWVFLHRDQNDTGKLADPAYLAMVSFRETILDALDPGRLSFNPSYWWSYWSAWAAGEEIGFSRLDFALLALLTETENPHALLVEQGPATLREQLIEHFYRPMPGLAALSLACAFVPEPEGAAGHRRHDVAIVGWMNGTGLARNMAMIAEALCPLSPLIFDAHSGNCVNAKSPDDAHVRARVVILCVNADAAPEVLGRLAPLCADAHVIGFFLWETDHPPASHVHGVRAVDEIWCPTHYVADAYRTMATVPVSVVGKGLRAPDARTWTPFVRRFRRESAPFTFLCIAEFGSSVIRKNPLDAVRAFQAAFDRANHNVRFLLKMRSIQPSHWSNLDGYWEEIVELAAADPRIEIVVGDLPEEEYWALLSTADAVVSLHRGEGFGYPIADAMMLGRPIVVSDYSGSADFCDEETAFLVDVDVIPTPPEHLRQTGYIGNWCVPRLESAVAAMRRVVARRDEAERRGAAGRARIARDYDFEKFRNDLLDRVEAALRGGAPDAASPVR